jgi:hypothetical protein
MWMHTIWDGSFFPIRNVGPQGDYVDLLAHKGAASFYFIY